MPIVLFDHAAPMHCFIFILCQHAKEILEYVPEISGLG